MNEVEELSEIRAITDINRVFDKLGDKALCQAIIGRAIQDLCFYHSEHRFHRDAKEFFEYEGDPEGNEKFSFNWLCNVIDVSPTALKKEVFNQVNQSKKIARKLARSVYAGRRVINNPHTKKGVKRARKPKSMDAVSLTDYIRQKRRARRQFRLYRCGRSGEV